MSTLTSSVEHALAAAAIDTVKAAKFVETSVLPVLKKAQADQSTIEAVTALVSPQAANIERAAFAVLGVVINAMDAAGAGTNANGLNVTLDAQLITDVKAIASACEGCGSRCGYPCKIGSRSTHSHGQTRHWVKSSGRT